MAQQPTQHTPGPWRWEHDVSEDAMRLVGLKGEIVLQPVCDCGERTPSALIENPANARLIAAAPDLWEACKGYVKWSGDMAYLRKLTRTGRGVLTTSFNDTLMLAAIAKAEPPTTKSS